MAYGMDITGNSRRLWMRIPDWSGNYRLFPVGIFPWYGFLIYPEGCKAPLYSAAQGLRNGEIPVMAIEYIQ